MIKRKVIETVEEYDANCKLTRKVTTETTEDDNSPQKDYVTVPYIPQYPYYRDTGAWWGIFPPYPYQYPSVSSNEYKVTIGDPPGSSGSGSISSAPYSPSNTTKWDKGNTTPTL